jgi:transposase
MVFVKVMKNREGKQYVSVVEGYRVGDKVKHRTIEAFGRLDLLEAENPNFLPDLKTSIKDGTYVVPLKQIKLNLDLTKKISNPLKNYGWLLLDSLYKELDITSLLSDFKKKSRSKIAFDKVLRLLVTQRILEPQSKAKTLANQGELFGDFDFSYQDIYRALDVFDELSDAIQHRVHDKVTQKIGRTGALVFYDVTNYYFETDLDDLPTQDALGNEVPAFRKRGPSKEKRPNPIVQMGLFMDHNGIPIAYRLFPGNCVDVKTYLPAIAQIKEQFGLERLVVVADKGMNSKDNIIKTLEREDGYLFSQKVRGTRGAPKDIQNFVLDDADWRMNEKETFAMKSFIRKRVINKQEITEKVLATWNQKYDFREKVRRQKSVEYAEKLTAGERFRMTMKKGGKRYLDVETINSETGEVEPLTPHISIDEKQIKFDEQFDGINVLITSEIGMSDTEMLKNYRSLSKIEDCFRVLKTDFDARPIFVWTKEHINAHFLICFLGLVMMRILEIQIDHEMTPLAIQEALNSARCRELSQGYWEVFGNEGFISLTQKLGLSWELQYVPLAELKKFARGLCIQQK